MKDPYVLAILVAIALGVLPPAANNRESQDDEGDDGPSFCSETAELQLEACLASVRDDFFTTRAGCVQIVDPAGRSKCLSESVAARGEGFQLCSEQREARLDLCGLVGEGRYDPEFRAELYVADYGALADPNPYYPLVIGHRWEFQAADESHVIEVLGATELIEGVTCIVVDDDWYAQRLDGTVSHCGEEGSFRHGRDGDLAGTIMPGSPVVGEPYRQEMSPGRAEDAAIVLSTSYGYGRGGYDAFVPPELARLLCANDCLIIGEFTPVEPELFDLKYYAYGIGLFLEVNPGTGEINRLVDCNFDARCKELRVSAAR